MSNMPQPQQEDPNRIENNSGANKPKIEVISSSPLIAERFQTLLSIMPLRQETFEEDLGNIVQALVDTYVTEDPKKGHLIFSKELAQSAELLRIKNIIPRSGKRIDATIFFLNDNIALDNAQGMVLKSNNNVRNMNKEGVDQNIALFVLNPYKLGISCFANIIKGFSEVKREGITLKPDIMVVVGDKTKNTSFQSMILRLIDKPIRKDNPKSQTKIPKHLDGTKDSFAELARGYTTEG